VDFAAPIDAVQVLGATVTRVEGARQWLSLPAGAPTGPVVAALATAHEVADLSIREPSIEDVLPHLYTR
jgi:ABC-2 type transport system ATP-binding protein